MNERFSEKILLGWREWVQLPELTDISIKAKVDTGARTSALHAFYIEPYRRKGKLFVCFRIHPYQKNTKIEIECRAPVADYRYVSDSGGHREKRYVIETRFVLGDNAFTEEITLTDRDPMLFRMLLGRNVLRKRYIVDSGSSFHLGGTARLSPDLT